MKRYAIVELGEMDLPENPNYYDNVTGKLFPVLSGPVELMQAACKEAGVKYAIPKPGDYYFGVDDKWSKRIIEGRAIFPVIPGSKPEKEKPCPNCHWTAEWQVADPGGIGCGGTGGPL